ncbi:unnamed protein product [Polarella glacialis]|uniref:Uncharacterized protein n=1 Tax=Polarella glacialis TaxID=89957 RepID=A0A813GZR7_POLGL|nr:unnamed protein product [Polarella glacialis]CAE8655188.1 unnamed protein product [Polarella glacialis]CAE8743361.1 unnamed protein product [Polarella glacialis]
MVRGGHNLENLLDGSSHGPIRPSGKARGQRGGLSSRGRAGSEEDPPDGEAEGQGTEVAQAIPKTVTSATSGSCVEVGPWPQLPLAWLSLLELRAASRASSREWCSAVDGLEVKLSPSHMDAWLRHRFLEVLRAPQLTFPCAASMVYGTLRARGFPLLSEDVSERSPDQESVASLLPGPFHLVDWRPDVRQSSHRSLARLVKALVKEGLVTAKEIRIRGIGRRSKVLPAMELQITAAC